MNNKSYSVVPGGVDEYLHKYPKEVQGQLEKIRAAIRDIANDATETVSYFGIPGYCYKGYDYNGMFAWFSFKTPYVRLHVRPPVIQEHKKELEGYPQTKSIVSFLVSKKLPMALIKKLVKASLKAMKKKSK